MKWTRLCRRNLILGLVFLFLGIGLTLGLLLPGSAWFMLPALAFIAIGIILLR